MQSVKTKILILLHSTCVITWNTNWYILKNLQLFSLQWHSMTHKLGKKSEKHNKSEVMYLTHTQNMCSAFNPSKCTHTVVNTHTRSSEQPTLRRLRSSCGFGALLKGLTAVVVLKVERALVMQSPTYNPCRTWDSTPRPSGYKSDSLSFRPRLLQHNTSRKYGSCTIYQVFWSYMITLSEE